MGKVMSLSGAAAFLFAMVLLQRCEPQPVLNTRLIAKQMVVDIQTAKVKAQMSRMSDKEIARGIVYEP